MSSSTPNDKKHLTSSSRYDLRHHIRPEKPFSIKTSIRSEKLLSIKPTVRLEKPLSIKPQVLVVDTYHSVKVETPNIHSPVEAPTRNGNDNDAISPPVVYPCGKCSQDVTGFECVKCDGPCGKWYHTKCCMHKKTFEKLGQHSEVMWVCKNCKASEKKPVKPVKVIKWG